MLMSLFLYVTLDGLLQSDQSLISTWHTAFAVASAALSSAELLQESSRFAKIYVKMMISLTVVDVQLQRTTTNPYRE